MPRKQNCPFLAALVALYLPLLVVTHWIWTQTQRVTLLETWDHSDIWLEWFQYKKRVPYCDLINFLCHMKHMDPLIGSSWYSDVRAVLHSWDVFESVVSLNSLLTIVKNFSFCTFTFYIHLTRAQELKWLSDGWDCFPCYQTLFTFLFYFIPIFTFTFILTFSTFHIIARKKQK